MPEYRKLVRQFTVANLPPPRAAVDDNAICFTGARDRSQCYLFGQSRDRWRCWYDYRFQLFRGLLAVLILAPSWAKQRRSATGMFAAEKDGFNTKLAAMYAKYNERVVAALTDHEWLDMLLEGAATCGPCSCLPCCP